MHSAGNYKVVMQLQHQIQDLRAEARQMVVAPVIDGRYGVKLVNNLLSCASKADRASLPADAAELRRLAAKLQARLRVDTE